MSTRVVVCCGSGGVGKTTVSAGLAVKWAKAGARVVVLTIDPARRLADSLSLTSCGNVSERVELEGAELDAVMLDAASTFEQVVQRFSPNPEVARRILEHRYYQVAAGRLAGIHEYMAMERLLQLWESGAYDVIVLDTPPARNAVAFLEAPARVLALVDEGVIRWLAMPSSAGGWRALELGSEMLTQILRRLVGQHTVTEIASFFDAFRELWGVFGERSSEVHALLRSEATRFVMVTTPAPAARSEATRFCGQLKEQGLPFAGFIANRTVVPAQHTLSAADLPSSGPLDPPRWQAVTDGLTQLGEYRQLLASQHQQSIAFLEAQAPCWTVPDLGVDIHDLAGLQQLGEHLPPSVH